MFLQKTDLNSFVKVSDPGGFKWRLVIAYDGTKFAGSSFRTVTVSLSQEDHTQYIIVLIYLKCIVIILESALIIVSIELHHRLVLKVISNVSEDFY